MFHLQIKLGFLRFCRSACCISIKLVQLYVTISLVDETVLQKNNLLIGDTQLISLANNKIKLCSHLQSKASYLCLQYCNGIAQLVHESDGLDHVLDAFVRPWSIFPQHIPLTPTYTSRHYFQQHLFFKQWSYQ